MRSLCALVVALVVVPTGCLFDPAVPTTASLSCASDDDCLDDGRCQPATRLCVGAADFDADAPALLSATISLAPPAGALVAAVAETLAPFPGALGPGGLAEVTLGISEPLRAAPDVVVDGPLACATPSLVGATWTFACAVADGGAAEADARALLSATLVDVAGNRATVDLGAVVVDTVPPPAPDGAGLQRRRAPWGTRDDATDEDVVAGGAATVGVDDGDAVAVVVSVDGRLLAVVRPDDDGGFGPVSTRDIAPEAVVAVRAVDAAGNVGDETPVATEVFVATMNGKQVGRTDENPHTVASVGAVGTAPLRRDRTEHAGFRVGDGGSSPAVVVGGTGAWRRGSDPLPGVFGRALLLPDPLRGRVLRFGGLVRQEVFLELLQASQLVGPALGVNDAWEWNGLGWSIRDDDDPEADDRPAGRVAAAGAVDVQRGLSWVHGGNLANSDPAAIDVDVGVILDDTWTWNGSSWRHVASGGPALRGAAAMVDRNTGDLVVVFGTGQPAADGTPSRTACVSRLAGGTWTSPSCPDGGDDNVPSPRAFVAEARDHADNALWLFGGETTGGVLDELWRLFGDGTLARVQPADDVAPPPRAHAAAAWDDRRRRLVVFGGVDERGAVLADVWTFDADTGVWAELDVDGAPSLVGLREPLLAWDDARDELVLQASELLPDLPPQPPFPARPQPPRARTLVWHPATNAWDDRSDVVAPAPMFHTRLACGAALPGCVLFDRGRLERALLHDGSGWRADPASDPLIAALRDVPEARDVELVTWSDADDALIAIGGNDTFVFRSGQWQQVSATTPAHDTSSALAATAQGVLLACTNTGLVHRFDVVAGTWTLVGPLPDTSGVVSGLQWLGLVDGPPEAHVQGLKITTPLPIDGCPQCPPLPTAIVTVARRWSVAAAGITLVNGATTDVTDVTDFGGFSAVSAQARDARRSRALFFGGVGLGSDRPTPLLLAQDDVAADVADATAPPPPTATAVAVSDVDGDGFPRGRVAASLAADDAHGTHVLVGGSTSVRDWGLFQAKVIADLTSADVAVIAFGCGFDAACIDRQTAARLPDADLNDTWLLSFDDEHPALLVEFDLASLRPAAGAPSASVRVIAEAGGDGHDDDGAPVAGARIAVWNGTRYVDVGAGNDASAQSPGLLEVDVGAPPSPSGPPLVDVARLAREGSPLRLAIVPRGRNGATAAQVSLDAITLEVTQLR